MNWPSQKSAPLGSWQAAWQTGSSRLAVHMAWHVASTWMSHETLQAASHWVWHETVGGFAWQVNAQRLSQSPWQSVMQPASLLQAVEQLASHWVVHEPMQSNEP